MLDEQFPERYPNIKPIAFFLPQFHPVRENDEWWGTGFTEWRSCTSARPLFPGHIQPKLPGDLGFYDLRRPEVQKEQAELAKAYGVRGFCHHFYWFDGRRILEQPTETLLANKDIDIEFCLCWANESWTRRWDGQDHNALLEQNYDPSTFGDFARELLRYFEDDRYIKLDGKPVLVIYRCGHVKHMEQLVETLRTTVEKAGFPGLYLLSAETFVEYGKWENPAKYGLDGAVEFPPHATRSEWINPHRVINEPFEGHLYEQLTTYVNSIVRPDPDFTLFRCLFPEWDNTARRDSSATIYLGGGSELFAHWLDHHCQWTERIHSPKNQLLFINAWNEWAEGACLEPDILKGKTYLETVRDVLNGNASLRFPVSSKEIASLGTKEREHFAETYIAKARPELGFESQLLKPPEPKFRVPKRLYTHSHETPFMLSLTKADASKLRRATLTNKIKSIPRNYAQLKYAIAIYLRVERPTTLSERARLVTYYVLRTCKRVVLGRSLK